MKCTKILKLLLQPFILGGATATTTIIRKSAYNGYFLSTKPSDYELVMNKLDFNGINEPNLQVSPKDQQKALLTALYYAEYFKPQSLWNAIIHMEFSNSEKVFKSIIKPMIKSETNQDDPSKFNPKILRKNLFKDNTIRKADMADLLLYLGKNAFERGKNQKRYQLTTKNWMKVHKIPYIDAATKLELIVRVSPKYTSYDEAFIAGAARIGILVLRAR